MVVGALIVKHMVNLGDEKTIQAIQENPYMQYLLGWRKRSIPTHSEWLYPLTFDAGKGLKEAKKTEHCRSTSIKTPQNASKNGALPFTSYEGV